MSFITAGKEEFGTPSEIYYEDHGGRTRLWS